MAIRKKESNNKLSKSWLILIGSLVFIAGICIILFDVLSDKNIDKNENNALKEFYIQEAERIEVEDEEVVESPGEEKKTQKIEYIAALKIPKISLERGLVNPSSYLNNIQYNVAFLKDSAMPDQINGNVILAAHSGNARISYFRKLDKLSIDDKVMIDYKGKTYTYSVVHIYDIEKTGKAKIIRNQNTNTLTLITCRHNTNNQIVIICELLDVS